MSDKLKIIVDTFGSENVPAAADFRQGVQPDAARLGEGVQSLDPVQQSLDRRDEIRDAQNQAAANRGDVRR